MSARGPGRARSAGAGIAAAVLLGLGGCDGDSTAPGPAPAYTVELEAPAGYVVPGDAVPLTVRVLDADGRPTGEATVEWSSSRPDVAQVDASGVLMALAPGEAVITASVTGDRASILVEVIPPVLVGAGDIASCDRDGDEATAKLLDGIGGIVFTTGDNAYVAGTAREFEDCYGPSWGRHRARTRPSVGNHEYRTEGAAPYFAYFGDAAGEPGAGYYSYDIAGWHVVVLNSEIDMGPGSAQLAWLEEDLSQHEARCTLAYWHRPLFSSSRHGNQPAVKPLWEALYEAGAEVVVNGHDHSYERFAPQTPAGVADAERGIREFVVGTGGRSHYEFVAVQPNSELRHTGTFGVLKLTLHAEGYAWEFVPAAGGGFRDSGTGSCH
ncbi:MAG TPA: metallophosphoesterase [Longimicrobiales bacterium]